MSRITLKQANTIIEQALVKAKEMKVKPLTVVVLDDSGNVVAVTGRRADPRCRRQCARRCRCQRRHRR